VIGRGALANTSFYPTPSRYSEYGTWRLFGGNEGSDIADPALESLQVLRAKHKIDKMDDGVPLGGL